jgi:hypothetical protein
MRGWASFGGVFMRGGYGTHYFEWICPIGCLVYIVYVCACSPAINSEPWIEFGILYLALVALHRQTAYHSPRRDRTHSFFEGHSLLTSHYNWRPGTAKKFGDPIFSVLLGVGMAAAHWENLAVFMWISALMGGIDGLLYENAIKERTRMMRDAQIEQDQLMDEFDLHNNRN